MNNWKPVRSGGGRIGLVLTILVGALFGVVFWQTLAAALVPESAGANFGTFLMGLLCFGLLAVTAGLALRTFNFFRLRYTLDRNAVVVLMGDRKHVIPLASILHAVPARILLAELARGGSVTPTTEAKPRVVMSEAKTGETTSGSAESLSREVPSDWDDVEKEFLELRDKRSQNGKTTRESTDTPGQTASKPAGSATSGTLLPSAKVQMRPLAYWKGCYFNQGYLEPLGPIQFYSTAPFTETLLLRTKKAVYAISPDNPQQFLVEYTLRRNLGPTETVTEGLQGGLSLNHPLRFDLFGRIMLALGIVVNLLMFMYLFWRLPELPELLRLHFNKFGEVDRIGPRGDIMWLPFIGLLTLFVNSFLGAVLYKKDKLYGYLLFISTLIIEFFLWVGIMTITADRIIPG
jgi:hypothetical protein